MPVAAGWESETHEKLNATEVSWDQGSVQRPAGLLPGSVLTGAPEGALVSPGW